MLLGGVSGLALAVKSPSPYHEGIRILRVRVNLSVKSRAWESVMMEHAGLSPSLLEIRSY